MKALRAVMEEVRYNPKVSRSLRMKRKKALIEVEGAFPSLESQEDMVMGAKNERLRWQIQCSALN